MVAYLDIETTGLSSFNDRITVIGVALTHGRTVDHVQLYDDTLTSKHLAAALQGVTALYTYNGERFDLPFIAHYLGVDLAERFRHHDLMYDCWQKRLYGGLKAVEARLGIGRKVVGVNGYEAVLLWQRYEEYGDAQALETLLAYNREDAGNLILLRKKLKEYSAR
ncbi:MAG: ribonuclease H-like domain-containing protein [Chloroflexi bacterium]|nr:ribonuclease H-like domain-containing protein [Chloroflexota bacterium]